MYITPNTAKVIYFYFEQYENIHTTVVMFTTSPTHISNCYAIYGAPVQTHVALNRCFNSFQNSFKDGANCIYIYTYQTNYTILGFN